MADIVTGWRRLQVDMEATRQAHDAAPEHQRQIWHDNEVRQRQELMRLDSDLAEREGLKDYHAE